MTALASGGGLLEGLLPAEVAVVETFCDPLSVELFALEADVVANAVESRRREFASVRWRARAALAQLGRVTQLRSQRRSAAMTSPPR